MITSFNKRRLLSGVDRLRAVTRGRASSRAANHVTASASDATAAATHGSVSSA